MFNKQWKRVDDAITDFEEKCISGKGIFKSSYILNQIGINSVYKKGWFAAAKYIDKLESYVDILEKENLDLKKQLSQYNSNLNN